MMKSRTILLSTAAVCLLLVAFALYLQHVKDMLPCPLCVIQRYLFLAVAIGCLIGAFGRKPKVGAAVGLAAAIGGLGVVGKHLYVLANPGFSCGIDPMTTALNKIPTATYLPWLFEADGLCENATDAVLGLSVPQWSAVWFAILTATMIWVLARRQA
ncbi:disulfide bond formation protein B [Massilia dura]|uniref:Disulfide bond formation protein B n=1 Tax=Pseudoduganella dura TaxID=321982 RepID=A0A6I3XLA6_9BURK|nr:disulfide bond formation protein B [Pseudoduganella dura]MUI13348.1 disulfide bond formation protein B [Pseudoduganella dura]GGX84103.1 disulfide bond formation protein B [Pseudoduganella dura]